MINTQSGGIADMAEIEMAVKFVEKHNNQDMMAPGLLELTSVSEQGTMTASGLDDYDYENICNLSLGQKELRQVQTINKIPIPSVVLEHFKSLSSHIEMGLFPEIGRAYLTIDSELYIWTYEPARDVVFFDGLNQTIVGVGLVKPRQNVFVKEVQHLLILTTPLEIAVLGVTFGKSTKTLSSPARNGGFGGSYGAGQNVIISEELELMERPIFVLGTDDVNIRIITGSADGRIFLGGKDGCLYEILYQADSGWFGKACRKVNHSKGLITTYMSKLMKAFGDPDPITQISIDNSRRLLYVLTERGCIEAWAIGENSSDVTRITRISGDEILRKAAPVIATVDQTVFKEIKSISALTTHDSNQINLIAVTQCGVRFYFSTTPPHLIPSQRQQQLETIAGISQVGATESGLIHTASATPSLPMINMDKNVPQNLYLLHIRLPPGYTTHVGVHKPKFVHTAMYSDGCLLLISTTPQRDQGTLLSLSAAPFPNRPRLTESATLLPLDGLVWDMAAMSESTQYQLHSIIHESRNPKKVMLLTHQGIHVIALLKPADILHQLLVACHGPQHEAVKNFFQVQTPREACYACLLIICAEKYRNADLSLWAAQALLLYGGDPTYQQFTSITSTGGMIGQKMQSPVAGRSFLSSSMYSERTTPAPILMSTPFPNAASTLPSFNRTITSMSPTLAQSQPTHGVAAPFTPIIGANQGNYPTEAFSSGAPMNLVYSAKHDALYLYVARLLRPIWKVACVRMNLSSVITLADCASILDELHAIRAFLDGNAVHELSATNTLHQQTYMSTPGVSSFITPNSPNNNQTITSQQDQRRFSEQAHNEEKRSLIGLINFIRHTCEVIGFWKILCEHEISTIAGTLRKEQQDALRSYNFSNLILSYDMCCVLIVALINSYLNDNASIGSISTKLREVCPTLYRHEDAVSYKATELLRNSANYNNLEDRQERFLTALQLCKDAAPSVPLQHICQQFILVGYYQGVIELSATCAAKTDPEQYGIHYYNKGEMNDDRDGYAGYASRMMCYKEVRLMLDHIYEDSAATYNTANQTNLSYFEPPFPANTLTTVGKVDAKAQIMQIVALGLQINDPLLHVTLYEWLLSHEMLSELLGLTEPSLGEFLRRNVVRNPENLQLVDLLWKYYEKNDQHAQAAQILNNLASTESRLVPLEQRIEYLARAVMCMRNESVGYSVSNGILLKELEDKLEIARVQKCVLGALNANPSAVNAINELNYALYDITQLYQNFAEPFNLWECKLTILNCSHHNDPLLIESVWSQIINKAVAGSESSIERSNRLFIKIEALVREFRESGHCFPLAFLVRELEVKACQLRFPEGIVPEKLIAMNLDIELIMEYYARMISMNERVWANEGNEWHLVQSSIRLVTLLTNNVQTVWHRSKRRVFGKAQDIVSACLNLCYPKPGTEQLQHALKELQCRLQRSLT